MLNLVQYLKKLRSYKTLKRDQGDRKRVFQRSLNWEMNKKARFHISENQAFNFCDHLFTPGKDG